MSATIATALRRISVLNVPAEALREMISIVADLVGIPETAERAVAPAPAAVPERVTSPSTERVRRHRAKRKAVAAGQGELFRASLAVDNTRNAQTPVSPFQETLQRKVSPTPPSKESFAEADAGARAPPSKSLICSEAFNLADELLALQRFDREDPRAIGTAYAVQEWLTKGWKPDLIRQAVETVMARLKGIPPRRLSYFEPAIAEAHARAGRPLPTASVPPLRNVQVLHATGHGEPATDWRARRDNWHAARAELRAVIDEAKCASVGGSGGDG